VNTANEKQKALRPRDRLSIGQNRRDRKAQAPDLLYGTLPGTLAGRPRFVRMRPLSEYNAKRDFTRTKEPPGKLAKSDKRRFVIQRHAATRLHYDLRLELGGVYKSWAVTKTPSLDPAVKRLAVEVEDHPIEYGTFEGTIPKGQYGGGTVQLWDRGTWRSQTNDPKSDLADGHLKIVMDGERMKGKWALVRMRDDKVKPGHKAHHNWLLIKEVDGEARHGAAGDALAKDVTSVKSGRTLDEIADKSGKVWNSNRPVEENIAALSSKKKPAKKAKAKKRTPAKKKSKKSRKKSK
jgi:bifunctional non-homologous end joining protein LigD